MFVVVFLFFSGDTDGETAWAGDAARLADGDLERDLSDLRSAGRAAGFWLAALFLDFFVVIENS